MFNTSYLSFYSLLYYFSGVICPILVCINSLNKFTFYEFNITDNSNKKTLIGKQLFIIVLVTLTITSIVISYYFVLNIDLIIKLFFDKSLFSLLYKIPNISYVFTIFILLIFKNTRIFIKKAYLANYLLLSILLWYTQINNIEIGNYFFIYKVSYFNNINQTNIVLLLTIESIYYLWSLLSYKRNLSDWIVPVQIKSHLFSFFKILFFYFFIFIYYSLI